MRLSFIGAGNMATAIAHGLIQDNVFATEGICASDAFADAARSFTAKTNCVCIDDNEGVVARGNIVILAVKPQNAAEVLSPLKGKFDDKLLISIAAGLRLEKIEAWTGSNRVIRVMPNTPAMVRMGASVYSCAPGVTQADREIADRIFSAIGYACEMSEDKLDGVTALSGSGPAFLFAYVEAMLDGASQVGLPAEEARELAVATIAGAAEMLKRKLGTPQELREAVTSKGGTTAAGLAVLKEQGFHDAIVACLQAACSRSIELGK